MKNYKRITIDPKKMGGVPCIRNLRMPVATIIEMLAEGYTPENIIKEPARPGANQSFSIRR